MLVRARLHQNNINAYSALQVRNAQQSLIANCIDWLLEAQFVSGSETWGLADNSVAVGLYSLIDQTARTNEDEHFRYGYAYLWRLMIDQHHQNKGYGKAAIGLILADAGSRGFRGLSLTTMDKKPGNALEFYQQLGFTTTDRRLDGEIELLFTFA